MSPLRVGPLRVGPLGLLPALIGAWWGLRPILTYLGLGLLVAGQLGWDWRAVDVELRADRVLEDGQVERLLLSLLGAASDLGRLAQGLGLGLVGRRLERRHGSLHYLGLVGLAVLSVGLLQVGLATAWAAWTSNPAWTRAGSLGGHGLLVALRVAERPGGRGWLLLGLELAAVGCLSPPTAWLSPGAGLLAGLLWARLPALGRFPVTLLSAGLLTAGHLHYVRRRAGFWSTRPPPVCLRARDALSPATHGWRWLWAPLVHESHLHGALCLASLLIKGHRLEPTRGPVDYALTLLAAWSLTSLVYVSLGRLALEAQLDGVDECVQGLSGGLFALKVLSLAQARSIWTPTGLFEVVELLMLAEPRTCLFHVAGLVAGLILLVIQPSPPVEPDGARPWTRSWGYGGYEGGPPAHHWVDPGHPSPTRWSDESSPDQQSPTFSLFSSRSLSGSDDTTNEDSSSLLSEAPDNSLDDSNMEDEPMAQTRKAFVQDHGRRSQTPSPSVRRDFRDHERRPSMISPDFEMGRMRHQPDTGYSH